jgi:2-succinyl-5-enolpyruvyl-6-hydroxy-3-cyclohexene-1-carboxylate synthase
MPAMRKSLIKTPSGELARAPTMSIPNRSALFVGNNQALRFRDVFIAQDNSMRSLQDRRAARTIGSFRIADNGEVMR